AAEDVGAFLELVLPFQSGVQPLEVRMVPQHVGLFGNGDASRNPVLNQKSIADMLEHSPATAGRAPPLGELTRKGLDRIEPGRDFSLVTGQDHAFRKRVTDDQDPLERQNLEVDGSSRRDLLVSLLGQLDRCRLLLPLLELASDVRVQLPQQLSFLGRSQPGQDYDAIAEQGYHSSTGSKRERRSREDITVLKACGVDPIAHQHGMRRCSTISWQKIQCRGHTCTQGTEANYRSKRADSNYTRSSLAEPPRRWTPASYSGALVICIISRRVWRL